MVSSNARAALWIAVLAGAVSAAKPQLGKPAPEFSLVGLNSEEKVRLSDFRGKVVLLDFWASWCLPCRKLMPLLAQIKERHPDLEILAVSVDVDRNKAISFLREVEPGFKAAHDARQETAGAYGV